MPIHLAEKGKQYILQRVCGTDAIRHQLAAMGFVAGECITVLSEVNNNFIILVKGSRIALGKELAKKIIVG